ncbi:3'-5' exonuclease [Acetobacter sp.]|jgi:DNA polymerase III epsilon subunit-like protein|uniref:3'-5' exonuclease n=1 Tax=Acetobacter sp. TaxID=440 RepID=UPI0025BD57D6|nr:exonuclease domain-containing protein [Acetobacter sp.]MCH4091709.1 hypothetical protein [Acetobacter sp.]MCI1300434.1 hypothetical protein [Acetobacter sp.]MCI1316747.1 hypothetical protein [Acetobacter sp.]
MFIFLDNEASSLDIDSYPVEIAWVRENGRSESFLIRPESHWTDWSEEAEALHGLSRDRLLREGSPAGVVARHFLATTENCRIVTDAPSFDRGWLQKLCEVVGEEAPAIYPVLEAWVEALRSARRETSALEDATLLDQVRMREEKRTRRRHRALPDALELWRVWRDLRDDVS